MKSLLQPTLIGKLVKIRPLNAAEFEALYAVASDPLIWEQHPQKDRNKKEIFKTYFDGAIQSNGAVIIEDANCNIIGASRFYDLDESNSKITIGYTFLSRQYWGHTHNKEVKALMLNHAFQFIDHVHFEIGENNLRSRKAIEKIGAKLIKTDTLDNAAHVIYRITKPDFYNRPLSTLIIG